MGSCGGCQVQRNGPTETVGAHALCRRGDERAPRVGRRSTGQRVPLRHRDRESSVKSSMDPMLMHNDSSLRSIEVT
jgi:hypothetical protein